MAICQLAASAYKSCSIWDLMYKAATSQGMAIGHAAKTDYVHLPAGLSAVLVPLSWNAVLAPHIYCGS